MRREPDRDEAATIPGEWTTWTRFRGTLAEHTTGEPECRSFERVAQAASSDMAGPRLRGNQDYPTLHLGRGTRWAKEKRP